eukprot:Skav228959  [mRNA]  locus=scaffold3906:14436:19976:+ [translate_table: standard]
MSPCGRKTMDSIYDFAFEVRLLLRNEEQPFDRLSCRWIVGSMALVLCEAKLSSQGRKVEQMDILLARHGLPGPFRRVSMDKGWT